MEEEERQEMDGGVMLPAGDGSAVAAPEGGLLEPEIDVSGDEKT